MATYSLQTEALTGVQHLFIWFSVILWNGWTLNAQFKHKHSDIHRKCIWELTHNHDKYRKWLRPLNPNVCNNNAKLSYYHVNKDRTSETQWNRHTKEMMMKKKNKTGHNKNVYYTIRFIWYIRVHPFGCYLIHFDMALFHPCHGLECKNLSKEMYSSRKQKSLL